MKIDSRRSQLALLRAALAESESLRMAGKAELTKVEDRAHLLQIALDAVPLGVVVLSQGGDELARNREAPAASEARHDQALVAHLVREVANQATRDGTGSATLELRGPAPRVVQVRAEQVTGPGQSNVVTVAVLEDVSERHRLDALRRDFVANVSHELRTPIGALAALAEAVVGEQDPEVIRRLAGRIGGEAERAGGLVSDLLDLSRVESSDRTQTQSVAVQELVAEAVARVRAAADERGITVDASASREVEMSADADQMVSALANLLDNAIKYSDAGSVVDLEVCTTEEEVQFLVRDHGIGIPTRDHERIFERFYRVDRARSRDTGGTGLGLSIVRHVALNHGGDVILNSREGEGSEFILRVPRVVS